MRYKLLALDLDGTLLGRDGTVGDKDRAAIAQLSARGVAVTIVTGRLYSGSRAAAKAIGIRGPIACINGSQVVDTREHTDLAHERISDSSASRLRSILGRHNIARYGLYADRIVYDTAGEPYTSYLRTWSQDVEPVADVLEHAMWRDEDGISALVAVGAEDEIERARDEIDNGVADAQVVSFAVQRYEQTAALIVRASGTDKGVALDWLCRHHEIALDEVVAVGDWLNDLPMFERAGRSFAMSYAPDSLKDVASDHLSRDGGVAEAIARAFEISV